MKIYTLTLHGAHNFGAMLQAYALRRALAGQGHDVQVIDYSPDRVSQLNKQIKWSKNPRVILRSARAAMDYRSWKRRYDAFEEFKDSRFHLTRRYRNLDELKEEPPAGDAYVCGSDQIWNPERPLKPEFFLGFGPNDIRRISYAASFGISTLPENQIEPLKKLLKPFDAVSLRERSGVEIVKEATGRNAELVVDPTLLLDAEEWREVMHPEPLATGRYLLVYCLEESPLFMRTVVAFANHTGLPVVVIGGSVINRFKMASEVHVGIGPAEYLRLFSDAELVVTNSFHGTAFALNFGRPLVSVPHTTRNDRMATLMESIGWVDSQWNERGKLDEMLDVSRKRADAATMTSLAKLRAHSFQFLDDALGGSPASTRT